MTDGQLKAFEIPVIGVSISAALDKAGQRTMVFQTHFPQDSKPQDLNKVLDVCAKVMERQHEVFRLTELRREIEVLEKNIKGATADLNRIDDDHAQKWENDGRRGPLRLTAPQEAARHNTVANLEHAKKELAWAYEQLNILFARIKSEDEPASADNSS